MVDIRHHSSHESGDIYDIEDHTQAVWISVIADDEPVDLIHAARSPNQPVPRGVQKFRGTGDGGGNRDALERAELWAHIHSRIPVDEPLQFQADIEEQIRRTKGWIDEIGDPEHHDVEIEYARVPVIVAAESSTVVAAYLAAHGFSNGAIANAMGLGSRTVSQYISDLKSGDR